ncbi:MULTISPECIES: efflux RND transporter periplasmic adaptor subunit [unclassified Rhizobium]|uniref:efflux RND transporter periplasmic adaptor subunit n=1 Tax=unclassified Rhizobium TaxID=2613769 RepID=UPI000EA93BCA|nr:MULTISPECIES: efflux RND transporter periplasmic adaptor subunit [unclassified Rhizobium]AYG67776.1 efflux RND transporter periplasmic adaptor subunit [Rhizobium sp. CCGE531]AYG74168.1 efflux RND transporter periplasmic adaptor subunit [Rhizobium sp. CCGE532]
MARTFRVVVWLAVIGAVGYGAYATRDRWLGPAEKLLGYQNAAAPAEQAQGERRGGGRGQGGGGGRRSLSQFSGPVPVLAADAKTADVPVYIDGVGSVKALNTVTVRAQVSGKIVEIDFVEGQDIKRGDVIARIDDGVYKAQRDQAVAKKAQDEALLAGAQRDLARFQLMVKSASGTQQQVDTQISLVAQYTAQVQVDVAAIESAQATLDYTTVKAPIDGRTGIRNVDIGNLVGSSDTTGIVTLSQIRPISVLFSIPQQQLARINAASAAGTLTVQAMGSDGQTVVDNGTLAVVDNQVDPTTGTVKLKANFPNDKLALWPGAFVNARLLVETLKGVTVIPSGAVQRGPNGTFVYSVSQGQTVAMKPVKVRQQDDTLAVIADGVSPGDKVVTTGFARLQDGSKVQISTNPDQAAPDVPSAGSGGQPVAENDPQKSQDNADGGERPHRRHNGQGGQGGQGGAGGHSGHRGQDGQPAAGAGQGADTGGGSASNNSSAAPTQQQ